MIITRKRFDREVRRTAHRLYREKVTQEAINVYADLIENLQARVRRLEKKELQGRRKGSISGFYATPTQTTIVRKEEVTDDPEDRNQA